MSSQPTEKLQPSKELSIVTTLYRSQLYVAEFHRQACLACQALVGDDFEIVYVVDGCPEGSLEVALTVMQSDRRVRVVDLSRNFGQHKAIMTGLAYASGNRVFLIDSDLEETPGWLGEFHGAMVTSQSDVAYGVQRRRKGGVVEVISGNLFYLALRFVSDVRYPPNIVTARLMSRRYVDALLQHREREIFIGGLWFITGFSQIGVPVDKRSKSSSSYTFWRRFRLVSTAILSFSTLPLTLILVVGLMIAGMSALYILWQLVTWFRSESVVTGWATVIASIWLLGGLTITFLGVIGAYIGTIFAEVKQRPYTIVRAVHGN